ncbi:MAG TPA: MFS transporter [Bacillales bacterium]|nr:MFS transporter [Bacillales bacterium]
MRKNIFLFYLYRIFSRLYFHLPILFVYFYVSGFTVFYVEILLAVYGLMIMIGTGINKVFIKTSKHRKIMISIGEVTKAAGLFFLLIANTFEIFLIGQILSGIGYGLTAGIDSSILEAILSPKEDYKREESNSASYMFIAGLIAGIVGSVFFSYNQEIPFIFSIIASFLAFVSILMIKVEMDEDTIQNHKDIQYKPTLKERFWINYYAITRAFTLASFVGFLPYFFFTIVKIDMYYFGAVLSLFTLSAFFSARYIMRINELLQTTYLLSVTIGFLVISMILFSLSKNTSLGLIAITLMGLASGGVRPLALIHIRTIQPSFEFQRIVSSSMEKKYGLWNSCLLLIGGYLITIISFPRLMIILSGTYLTIFIIIVLRTFVFKNIRNKTNSNISQEI